MGYPSFGPEAAQAFRVLLYCMAYVFGGAALIGLGVYIVLLGSEILFSEPRAKTKRVKVAQSASNARVAEANLPTTETPVLAELERRGNKTVRMPTLPVDTEMAPLVPVTLERDSTGP